MSTYVYMRFLESAPQRYDFGISLLSTGKVARLYAHAADAVVDGLVAPRVLEIGCGTGNLTRELLERGASVVAIDHNPEMLSIARRKLAGVSGTVEFREMAAVEIGDRFAPGIFDAIAATLVFSEMPAQEQQYVLSAAHRLLWESGRLVIGDEVLPAAAWQRCRYHAVRWPLAVITYLLTQTTTAALAHPAELLQRTGFTLLRDERFASGSMAVFVGEKRAQPAGVGS